MRAMALPPFSFDLVVMVTLSARSARNCPQPIASFDPSAEMKPANSPSLAKVCTPGAAARHPALAAVADH